MGIGAKQPVVGRAARGRVEVNYLGSGVNSAIGTPGTGQGDRFVGNPGQCGFDRLLHTGAVRLALPAAKTAAVIFDHRGHAVQSRRQFAPLGNPAVTAVLPGRRRTHPLPESGEQLPRGFLLRLVTALKHVIEDFPRPFRIPHIDIGFRQFDLGRHFLPGLEQIEIAVERG